MSDITQWHWDRLHAELLREMRMARALGLSPREVQRDKWHEHANAMQVALNVMARVARQPPDTEDTARP